LNEIEAVIEIEDEIVYEIVNEIPTEIEMIEDLDHEPEKLSVNVHGKAKNCDDSP
jgi:hypothetical protein